MLTLPSARALAPGDVLAEVAASSWAMELRMEMVASWGRRVQRPSFSK